MNFRQMITPPMTKAIVVLSAVAVMAGGLAWAQEEAELKPASDMTIPEIMIEAHKAPTRLLKRVIDKNNEASDADKQRLLALYKSMATQTPPKGDPDEWKESIDRVVAAAEAVTKGEEGAKAQLKKATNCMKCHKAHKADK